MDSHKRPYPSAGRLGQQAPNGGCVRGAEPDGQERPAEDAARVGHPGEPGTAAAHDAAGFAILRRVSRAIPIYRGGSNVPLADR